ncbi:MAG: SIS domain-containing protein [Clostridiales bacterium]|nr:SIS domain-containing protein [Clostridiales bacterium]
MGQIEELIGQYPCLAGCRGAMERALAILVRCYEAGGKVLVCGNGGSCADSDHIVGELMKGFCKARPLPDGLKERLREAGGKAGEEMASALQAPLPAISLCAHSALTTAFGNDADPVYAFAQQVIGYAGKDDALIGISTSGNAKNVVAAGIAAKALGVPAIGLCGEAPCAMDECFECVIHVPGTETHRVQELHLPVYHALCMAVEGHFYTE